MSQGSIVATMTNESLSATLVTTSEKTIAYATYPIN